MGKLFFLWDWIFMTVAVKNTPSSVANGAVIVSTNNVKDVVVKRRFVHFPTDITRRKRAGKRRRKLRYDSCLKTAAPTKSTHFEAFTNFVAILSTLFHFKINFHICTSFKSNKLRASIVLYDFLIVFVKVNWWFDMQFPFVFKMLAHSWTHRWCAFYCAWRCKRASWILRQSHELMDWKRHP